jgi:hypothetical protein
MSSGIHLYNNFPSEEFLVYVFPFCNLFCLPYVLFPARIRTHGMGGPDRIVECIMVTWLCLSIVKTSLESSFDSMGSMDTLSIFVNLFASYISQEV